MSKSIVLMCVFVSGCSIHPIPKQVTDVPTSEISRHISCETRDALRELVAEYLTKSSDVETSEIGRDLSDGLRTYSKSVLNLIPAKERKVIEGFSDTVVGYSYRFKITENNNNSGGLTLGIPFTNGNFSVALSGGMEKQRINERKFRTVTSFEELVYLTDCGNLRKRRSNYIYPIAGKIGISEVLATFIELSQFGGLEAKKTDVDDFSELLTFQTKIGGSVKPKVKINAVANQFRLSDANADFTADRTDIHEVLISLKAVSGDTSKPKAKRKKDAKSAVKQNQRDNDLSTDLRRALENL